MRRFTFLIGVLLLSGNSCLVVPTGAGDCASSTDPLCNPTLAYLLTAEQATPEELLSCQGTAASSPHWSVFGMATADNISSLCGLDDGGFLLLGHSLTEQTGVTLLNSHANSGVSTDIFLARIDSSGSMLWMKYFGDTNANASHEIIRTGENRFAIAGQGAAITSMQGQGPVSAGSAGTDMNIMSVDTDGNLLWYTNLGGTGIDINGGLAYNEFDDILFVGGQVAAPGIASINGQTPLAAFQGLSECAVFRMDPATGAIQWFTHLGGPNGDSCSSIATGFHGGPVIVGETLSSSINNTTPLNPYSAGGTSDFFTAMLELNGDLRWTTFFGNIGTAEESPVITRLKNGTFVVLGDAFSNLASVQGLTPIVPYVTPGGTIDPVIVNYDTDGSILFYTYHGFVNDDDGAGRIWPMPDGGFATSSYITDSLTSFNGQTPVLPQTNSTEVALFRYDVSGNFQWYSFHAHSNNAAGVALADGGFMVVGDIDANSPTSLDGIAPLNAYTGGGSDVGYIRLNENGRLQ